MGKRPKFPDAAYRKMLDRQVAFAWQHREHFEAVNAHNREVARARSRGGDAASYRNAWVELGFYKAEGAQ